MNHVDIFYDNNVIIISKKDRVLRVDCDLYHLYILMCKFS